MQGASDATLCVASGTAPFGRLARAKLGVSLCPHFPDSVDVPVSLSKFSSVFFQRALDVPLRHLWCRLESRPVSFSTFSSMRLLLPLAVCPTLLLCW